LQLSTTRFYF